MVDLIGELECAHRVFVFPVDHAQVNGGDQAVGLVVQMIDEIHIATFLRDGIGLVHHPLHHQQGSATNGEHPRKNQDEGGKNDGIEALFQSTVNPLSRTGSAPTMDFLFRGIPGRPIPSGQGTARSMTSFTPWAPTATPFTLPSRSPLCAMGPPDLEIRATRVTC